jgi:hypothetical protein
MSKSGGAARPDGARLDPQCSLWRAILPPKPKTLGGEYGTGETIRHGRRIWGLDFLPSGSKSGLSGL